MFCIVFLNYVRRETNIFSYYMQFPSNSYFSVNIMLLQTVKGVRGFVYNNFGPHLNKTCR